MLVSVQPEKQAQQTTYIETKCKELVSGSWGLTRQVGIPFWKAGSHERQPGTQTGAEAAILGKFSSERPSALFLKPFSWLNQVHPDYLDNFPYLRLTDYRP